MNEAAAGRYPCSVSTGVGGETSSTVSTTVRGGLFGVALSLHSYTTLRNGYAGVTIPDARYLERISVCTFYLAVQTDTLFITQL